MEPKEKQIYINQVNMPLSAQIVCWGPQGTCEGPSVTKPFPRSDKSNNITVCMSWIMQSWLSRDYYALEYDFYGVQ